MHSHKHTRLSAKNPVQTPNAFYFKKSSLWQGLLTTISKTTQKITNNQPLPFINNKPHLFFYKHLTTIAKISLQTTTPNLMKLNSGPSVVNDSLQSSFLKKQIKNAVNPTLNFSYFFSRHILKKNPKKAFFDFIYIKSKRSFWPLSYSPSRELDVFFLRKKTYLSGVLDRRALFTTTFMEKNKIRGVWSFFNSFKAPTSSFSRLRDFSRRLITVFWASQRIYKNYFDEKRHWTVRKFFHRFSKWYKKNTSRTLRTKRVEFWQFVVGVGICLSKRTTELSLSSGLIFSPINVTVHSYLDTLGNSILTISPQLLSFLETTYLYKSIFVARFNTFRRTQFLNRASQWRDIAKKKPKYFLSALQSFNANSNFWFFDYFSCSICFFEAYSSSLSTKPIFTHQLPRHNLEKLNNYKLRL